MPNGDEKYNVISSDYLSVCIKYVLTGKKVIDITSWIEAYMIVSYREWVLINIRAT